MQFVRFTKFWADLSIEQIGERAAALGYDGVDLTVRPGHAITPDNAAAKLPGAVRTWSDAGIDCAMISATTDLIEPGSEQATRLFGAAAEAGVPRVKIGYFKYTPGDDFGALFDRARLALEGFEALSRRTSVQTIYHTHSGLCLGSNCAALRHLLDGFDPTYVGAYPDLGHMAINGEDVQMGLPMIRERLAAVGAKDARHFRDERPHRRADYADGFVLIGQGAAEWREAVNLLHAWDFTGPVTVHTEYTTDQDVISTVGAGDDSPEAEALRARGEVEDLAFLRTLWHEAGTAA